MLAKGKTLLPKVTAYLQVIIRISMKISKTRRNCKKVKNWILSVINLNELENSKNQKKLIYLFV